MLIVALLLASSLSGSTASAASGKKAPVRLDTPSERIVLSVFASYRTGLPKEKVRIAAKTLIEASRENDVDPFVVLGLIRVESSGRNRARSSCDARGLMQIMPYVGKALAKETGIRWKGTETLHDPDANIRLGVHYFASLQSRYDGDVSKALSAYSMGPTKLDRILRRGRKPVDDYSISVQWFADHYRELATTHGNVEPGLSRFEIGIRSLEKKIGGKPSGAYALATGKKHKEDWNKSRTPKPSPAVSAGASIAAFAASAP